MTEKNRNLMLRIGTALVLVPVVLVCIYLGGWPFATLVAIASLMNAVELSAMSLSRGDPLRLIVAASAFAMPYMFITGARGGENVHWLWAALVIVAMTTRLFRDAPVETAARDVSAAVFAALYGSLVGYVVPLRNIGAPHDWIGGGWVILACVLTWFNDTGAYFAGRRFGRHKLYPKISPAKTWEGFFGGMASSIGGAFAVRALVLPTISPGDCVALGLLGGVFGPIGDLAESMLKRSCGVKDSGNLLPGHGGMLDRVDALLVNAPVVYLYCRFIVSQR